MKEDGLQQGLRVGGQLGDQRRQSEVDPQAVVWELADPGYDDQSERSVWTED